jgi:glycosyltransferase involved in cell wall biosynthesis
MPRIPPQKEFRVHQPQTCLSVVIPCYNERDTVAVVIDQVLASPWTAEVIVVDDGSTDGTRQVLAALADNPRLRVLLQPSNQGKGAALRRGFAAATGPYVIVQDADLEYDPGEYGALVQPLLQDDADVVFGSRFISSHPHRVLYYWHSVGNRFLTTLSNSFTNLNLTDMETCYKVFRREVIQTIDIEEDRFGVEPEVTAKVAAHREWRVYEVGIGYRGRTYADGKKIGWRDGVRAVLCIVKYSPLGERVRRALGTGARSDRSPSPAVSTMSTIDRPGTVRANVTAAAREPSTDGRGSSTTGPPPADRAAHNRQTGA